MWLELQMNRSKCADQQRSKFHCVKNGEKQHYDIKSVS